jgi:two-component system CitB family response regulator
MTTIEPPQFRVLVVEDDFRIAALHGSIVDAHPRFSTAATIGSVRGALRLLDSERPDLVLLDAYLPDAVGLEIVQRVDADVIMVTAANDAATVRRALRHGAFSYLVKPFDPFVLTARLTAYAAYRDALASAPTLGQADIDRALAGAHPPSAAGGRPRPATERAVLEVLADASEARSAPEVADSIGVSRATAQRHLGALAAEGLVDVQLKYGATGRPEHRYSRARP